jgi:hypothetical protein
VERDGTVLGSVQKLTTHRPSNLGESETTIEISEHMKGGDGLRRGQDIIDGPIHQQPSYPPHQNSQNIGLRDESDEG